MTSRRQSLTLAALLVAAAGGAAWWLARPPAPSTAGEPWPAPLVDGFFVPQGRWLDVREHFAAQQAAAETSPLPFPRPPMVTVSGGWGGAESWGGWGLGDGTRLDVFLRFVLPYDFYVVCRKPKRLGEEPQEVRLTVNGRAVGHFVAGLAWQHHRIAVPDDLLRLGHNEIALAYSTHIDGIPGQDDRPLALAIERLGLVPRYRDDEPPPAAGEPVTLDRERATLTFARSGTYLTPLAVPADAEALTLDVRFARRAFARAARTLLKVGVIDLAGGERAAVLAAPRWLGPLQLRHRLDLRPYRGQELFFELAAELPAGVRLEVAAPRLTVAPAPPPAAPTPPPDGRPPDVVIVVLDAARADHFGAYGYARDTTPHLDRFGESALRFDNAVAECPYTLCSMPNLLTGLSFMEHGVVTRGQTLAAEVETLAERLRAAGYLTLGFTGNPNSSRRTGLGQGFDELAEIWRTAAGRDRTHPHYMTRQVVARLDAGLDERPLFLFVHYVPPHSPYDPDPPFDLFGDPAYQGPVTPDLDFTLRVFQREVTLDGPDLARLESLYDGNLRMADDAVGELFAALARHGRWDGALVLVTADHGEAFMEHGWVGHNQTLYAEMLHVPFLLRLPGGARPAEVDLGRLVSLGNVAPTVLARAGLAPAPGMLQDLLDPRPSASSPQLLFLRTGDSAKPTLGVRTVRWKAIWGPSGQEELYDLQTDPGEERNLVHERRLFFTALTYRLERELRRPSSAVEDADADELSAEEEETLRTLGYL